MGTTNTAATEWPLSGMNRAGYVRCYDRALARMAATLNAGALGGLIPRTLLRQPDEILASVFESGPLSRLVRLHVIQGDSREDLEERAEDHFYGRFMFRAASTRGAEGAMPRVTVVHEATDTFIDLSLRRLRRPPADESALRTSEFAEEAAFASHCAANYLLKNFWHNYTHERMQGITHDNYGVFRGQARYDSDFEADNVADLLLLRSYGERPLAKGRLSEATRVRCRAVFERNKCNLVFVERAAHRVRDRESMSQSQDSCTNGAARWPATSWRSRW